MTVLAAEALRMRIWDLLSKADRDAVLEAVALTAALPSPSDQADELTAQCLFDAGFSIEYLGQDDMAMRLYRRVLDYTVVDTKYTASACFRIGVCLCRQGNLAEAVQCYRKTLPLARHHPHLLALTRYYLADLLEADERYSDAAELYEALLPMLPHPDINPNRARLNHARCCIRMERHAAATALLFDLARNREQPESVEAWQLLASIAEKQSDYAAAEKAYRQLMESPHADSHRRSAAAYRLEAITNLAQKRS